MANIYVRKSGNDSNDGSTPALAKLTIENAFAAASNSDKIVIGAGLYNLKTKLDNNSLNVDFYGDITGELTGDAGPVFIDGMNDSTTFSDFGDYDVINLSQSNISSFDNICFENIQTRNYYGLIRGRVNINNCSTNGIVTYYIIRTDALSSIKNSIFFKSTPIGNNIGVIYPSQGCTLTMENIIIDTIIGNKYDSSQIYCQGVNLKEYDVVATLTNCTIKNVSSHRSGDMIGIGVQSSFSGGGDITVNLKNCNFINNYMDARISDSGFNWIVSISNCNAFGSRVDSLGFTPTTTVPESVIVTPCKISPYSRTQNIGGTGYPTTDINGDLRPSYGNTNAISGAVEGTIDTVQKESTIKDSGDYSIKVSPCSYFKKQFQIPVTSSTLRTVKVKIRIDGTWGTYRPRVSLSGQGITLSQSTKNTTTEEFEELTVSGTPTTTGIALLTIEAHATDTSAVFYIDTVTLS